MAETQNVAWKHNEDEGIYAALPTSLFGQSGGPLLVGKFGWLQRLKPGVRKKSQTNEINKKKKPRENRRKKHASTPANGVATSGRKKHTSTISWFVWSGRGGSRADTVEERACQLQSLSHIGFLRAEEVKPRGRGAATTPQLLLSHFLVIYGCVSGDYDRVSLPDFSPLPRSVCVGSLECGPTRQLQSRLRSRGAFMCASEKEI